MENHGAEEEREEQGDREEPGETPGMAELVRIMREEQKQQQCTCGRTRSAAGWGGGWSRGTDKANSPNRDRRCGGLYLTMFERAGDDWRDLTGLLGPETGAAADRQSAAGLCCDDRGRISRL